MTHFIQDYSIIAIICKLMLLKNSQTFNYANRFIPGVVNRYRDYLQNMLNYPEVIMALDYERDMLEFTEAYRAYYDAEYQNNMAVQQYNREIADWGRQYQTRERAPGQRFARIVTVEGAPPVPVKPAWHYAERPAMPSFPSFPISTSRPDEAIAHFELYLDNTLMLSICLN